MRETERRHEVTRGIDLLEADAMVRVLVRCHSDVPDVVGNAATAALALAVEATSERLARGGRLIYAGSGTSGWLVAADAAEITPTFGFPSGQIDVLRAGEASRSEGDEDSFERGIEVTTAANVEARDVVIAVAASGETRFTIGCATAAASAGALTIALCNVADASLSRVCDIAVEMPTGPEPITGSTRMRAGLAQRLALTVLSTAVMVRLGFTFDNLMVNVQPKLHKLRERRVRQLAMATGLDDEAAQRALTAAGDDLKVALIAELGGITVARAAEALRHAGGNVRDALAEHAPRPGVEGCLTIDGGGTASRARFASPAGDRTATGQALTASRDPHLFAVRLDDLLAQLGPIAPSAVLAGFAGAGPAVRREFIHAALASRFRSAQVSVVRDIDLVLAQHVGPCVALIAGTGAIAVARDAAGSEVVVDGHGFGFGDRGSGAWIGSEAVGRALSALDLDGTPGALLCALQKRLGAPDLGPLRPSGTPDPRALGALVPLVAECASRGDRLAREVLDEAADHLATSALLAVRRAGLPPDAAFLLAGGVLTPGGVVRGLVGERLRAAGKSGAVRDIRPLDAAPTWGP